MKIPKIFKPSFLFQKDKESVHYKNLKNGEKIDIKGKEYVKVKLKFVDSCDHDSAKIIDNLETENKFLNEQNQKLVAKLELCNSDLLLLKQLNYNLTDSYKREATNIRNANITNKTYKNRITRLETRGENHKKHIHDLIYENENLKIKLDKQEHRIKELTKHNLPQVQNQELTKKLESLNNKVSLLEQLNYNLANNVNIGAIRSVNRDNTIIKYKKEITRLNKLTKTYKDQSKLLEKQNNILKIKLAKQEYKARELENKVQPTVGI